tara:strand:+ start:352 stop:561 length:210 start_codon:yes stop_codon:yes gene_type:complete
MSELDRQQLQERVIDSLIYKESNAKQLIQDHMNGLISECDFKTKMNALYGLGIDMNGKIMNANLNEELS